MIRFLYFINFFIGMQPILEKTVSIYLPEELDEGEESVD
jgi:hypothetical protein